MDPLQNNPTPNPVPNPNPNPNPVPVSNAMPNIAMAGAPAPAPIPQTPQMPMMPQMPAMPQAQESPVTPEAPAAPEIPAMPEAPAPTPVMEAAPAPAMSFESAFEGGVSNPTTSFNIPQAPSGIAATEPLTEPDPLPEPDPVEEALKAPIKAAEPVPGSIGSAVSVPFGQEIPMGTSVAPTQSNNVAFESTSSTSFSSDPMGGSQPQKAKNSLSDNKKLLMIIGIGAVAVIIAIIVVIMILGSGNKKINNQSSQNQQQGQQQPVKDPSKYDTSTTLSCTHNFEDSDFEEYGNATEGTELMIADFTNKELVNMTRTVSLAYEDEDSAKAGKKLATDLWRERYEDLDFTTDPFESAYSLNGQVLTATHKVEDVEDIDEDNMELMELTLTKNKEIDFSQDTIQENYEDLGFVCTVKNNIDK